MHKTLGLGGLALTLLPMAATTALAHGADKHTAARKTAATTYQCQKCHMKVPAAVAKRDHYRDPMDGGKLVPTSVSAGTKSGATGGMKM